ncbi:MAG: hypothetical protein J0H12_02955 [Candidatus Paracaedimonas acanthamoebae]|uniref:Uncharacterized protein n=1 Tax=Candidatus Paracaedimonas acanthamoebae TaxID=244581 RepID=A0A8J7PQT8_9PROT|nr:hypothetical protein [Candidatus Paracaedimonas acanthamoebae]
MTIKAFNWQLATGNWQLATGNWQLATGNWQLATGNWQLSKFEPIKKRFKKKFLISCVCKII